MSKVNQTSLIIFLVLKKVTLQIRQEKEAMMKFILCKYFLLASFVFPAKIFFPLFQFHFHRTINQEKRKKLKENNQKPSILLFSFSSVSNRIPIYYPHRKNLPSMRFSHNFYFIFLSSSFFSASHFVLAAQITTPHYFLLLFILRPLYAD